MIVTTYIYKQTGEPLWYTSSGLYNAQTGIFQSSYDSYSGGQCFGCPHTAPMVHSAAGGALTIHFHDNVTATLSWPGGSTEIQKYNYGFADATSVLYGEWAFSFNIDGLVGGDWVIFDTPYSGSDGMTYASGHTQGTPSYAALGKYDSGLHRWIVVVDSAGYIDSFVLGMDDHRAIGTAWVEPAGTPISGSGSVAAGQRLLFKSELNSVANSATTMQKSLHADDHARFVVESGTPANVDVQLAFENLRRALTEFKASR
ncbi:MAG: hypothetical protein ABIQ78_01525 [Dokdonella sp.]